MLDAPGGGPARAVERWLAWRAPRTGGGDRLLVRPLADPAAAPVEIAATRGRTQIGRPALSGDVLAWHVAGPAGSRIEAADLATGARRVLLHGTGATVSQPALAPGLLLYVRATYRRQQLRLAPLGGGEGARRSTGPSRPGAATPAARPAGTATGRATATARRRCGRGPPPGSRRRCGAPRWTRASPTSPAWSPAREPHEHRDPPRPGGLSRAPDGVAGALAG